MAHRPQKKLLDFLW